MAQKSNRINVNGIKIYGPVPRTLITLVTVLAVTTAFGTIGWRQLQVSRAYSTSSSPTQSSPTYDPNVQHYSVNQPATRVSTTDEYNVRTRLIWMGLTITVTLALVTLLHFWTKDLPKK